MEKILATDKAKEVISQLKERYGELMFYMSGGCCEGSQPMCYEKGEFKTGTRDVLIGEVEGSEFYLSEEQHNYYEYSQLLLDAAPGMGGGFSLETVLGMAFSITTHALISNEEAGVV
ncbi:DUF779 domain-containing protein [Pontibacter sp. HSC-36F09]|uniref:DUF779 domain-containing protein n=1 Tax=Pontibacter sp. HSC-36F09 TaxID=2910966 RepID=UPI00209EBBA4|nr:DUF779 domain-containing protein [Pontibacter sp. HSC-36F09]MCP2045484.1 uncharacterized protein (DUF779 family) [Pontibacter sp. HSC-36F09]